MKFCFDITLQDLVGDLPLESKAAITGIMDSLPIESFKIVRLLIQLTYGKGKLDGVREAKRLQEERGVNI